MTTVAEALAKTQIEEPLLALRHIFLEIERGMRDWDKVTLEEMQALIAKLLLKMR